MKHLPNTLIIALCFSIFASASAAAKDGKASAKQPPAAPAAATSTVAVATASAKTPLAASPTFFFNQGAHFEVPYETWQLSGHLTDQDGKAWTAGVLFNRAGSSYMSIRNGFASLKYEDDPATTTAFFSSAILDAALKTLDAKANVFQNRTDLTSAAEACRAGDCEGAVVLKDVADVYRTALYIRYGFNTFARLSNSSFIYTLNLDVRGNLLFLTLTADTDPIVFPSIFPVPVGAAGATLSGYVFPALTAKGMMITADHKVKMVEGKLRLSHIWGSPDRAAFLKYSIISLDLDNGKSLYSYYFYNTGGTLLSSRTYMKESSGKDSVTKIELAETEQWTSPLSGVTYPVRWTLKGAGVDGELSLDDKTHELSLIHGVGALYIGPCSFVGKATPGDAFVSGRGDCRLVNVEPVTK